MPLAISCFGDSTTFGTGSSNPATDSYPAKLAGSIGRTVNNFGVPSESSAQILARVLADTTHMNDIVVLWMGHNDAPRSTVVPNVALAVAHIVAVAGADARYLVMSVMNRTPYEEAGTAEHTAVLAMNYELQLAYGTRYIDIRGYLVHQYPRTPEGHSAHARDIPSFYVDSIHLNTAGYDKISQRVHTVVLEKGW